jgi:hypothetical protein
MHAWLGNRFNRWWYMTAKVNDKIRSISENLWNSLSVVDDGKSWNAYLTAPFLRASPLPSVWGVS